MQGARGGSSAAPLGIPTKVNGPEATGHLALMTRGHYCTVSLEVYLDLLQTVVWPEVRVVVTRRRFWLQQDGAMAHTAVRVREWLGGKSDDRVISRFSGRPCHTCHAMPHLARHICHLWTTGSGLVPSGAAEEPLGRPGGADRHCGGVEGLWRSRRSGERATAEASCTGRRPSSSLAEVPLSKS